VDIYIYIYVHFFPEDTRFCAKWEEEHMDGTEKGKGGENSVQ
jgi:hypothetical protein